MLSEGLSCAVAASPVMRQARRLPITMRPRDAHLMGRTLLSTFGIVVSFPGTMGAARPHRQQDYYEAAGNAPRDSPGWEHARQWRLWKWEGNTPITPGRSSRPSSTRT